MTDLDLLAHIGFTRQSEQALILTFAKERDLSVRALLAQALRVYHTQRVVGPEHTFRGMLLKEEATSVNAPPLAVQNLLAPTLLPEKPPHELLVSMAMRLDHSFGLDRHEVLPGYHQGYTPEQRAAVLVDMARLYEEVSGRGFYRWGQTPPDPLYTSVEVAVPPDEAQEERDTHGGPL